MSKLLTYMEFLNENDYRAVAGGSGSGGVGGEPYSGPSSIGGGRVTLTSLNGDGVKPSTELLELEEVPVKKDSNFPKKLKKSRDPDKEKIKDARKKLAAKFDELDKKVKNLNIKK